MDNCLEKEGKEPPDQIGGQAAEHPAPDGGRRCTVAPSPTAHAGSLTVATRSSVLLNGLSIAPSFLKPHYRSRRADQVPDRSDCPFLLPPRGDREEDPGLPPSLHDHGVVPVELHRLPRLQEVVAAVPAAGQPETSRQAAQGKFLPTAVDPEHRPIVEPYFHAVPLFVAAIRDHPPSSPSMVTL